MRLQNMTVRAKLAFAFGGLAALVLGVSALALVALDSSNQRFFDYIGGINARATVAQAVRSAVDRRAIAVRNLVLVKKPEDLAAEKEEVTKAHADVQNRLGKLKAMGEAPGVPDAVRQKISVMDDIEREYARIAVDIVKDASEGRIEAAIAKMNADCRPHLAALVKAVEDYQTFTAQREDAQLQAAADAYRTQRNVLIAFCLIALITAATAGAAITRSLTRQLGAEPADLNEAARRVANGDLGDIEGSESAVKGSVLASLAHMQRSLADIVKQVRNASDSIATGSSQIASGNADLSQRTEEQASAIQQTAATMEELGTTVHRNAMNAQQASQLAVGASDIAGKGGAVVTRVVETMQRIQQRSKRVADIIGVIDGIAFQTNILALNAAVEAARAGEQGRGFAVVASEVRSLAHRSAEAAKEIKQLINGSVTEVDAGTALADEAGLTMGEIVRAVQRVTDIVAEISTASAEQSMGVNQVGQAVTQMDQVTQRNAALVEESAASAESLRAQAQRLAGSVSIFKA